MGDLSPSFSRHEFEVDGTSMPEECVAAYTSLCLNILEPMREHVGQPFIITSGYRDAPDNAKDHGVADSQHVASATWCAADFKIEGMDDLRNLFDWTRLKSGLVIDQEILEHGLAGHDIIHVSWVTNGARLDALEGDTANREPYTRFPFNNPDQAQDQQWPLA